MVALRKKKDDEVELAAVKETEPEAKDEATLTTKDDIETKEGAHRFEMLRREIDRLFDDYGPSNWRLPFRRDHSPEVAGPRREHFPLRPAIDMVETTDGYRLTVELPGMSEKDVEIKLSNHHLTIRGEKTELHEEEGRDFFLSERSYGAFHRAFRLPDGVNEGRIDATMANGVLTVTVPKTAEAKKGEKTIKVKAV